MKKVEKLLEKQEQEERDYLKEALIVIPAFLLGVYVFGKVVDTLKGDKQIDM